MASRKEIDFDSISQMPDEMKRQAVSSLAKRANQRLRELENAGRTQYAYSYAQKYAGTKDKPRYPENAGKLSAHKLEYALRELERFLNAESSTLTGLKKIDAKVVQSFEDSGIHIVNKTQFFNFLSSKQFKTLCKMVDSDQIIEDFTQAMDDGYTASEIRKQYDEFLNSDMTFEQIAERRENGM